MDERLMPRSFTGLTDEEWGRFDTIVKNWLGRGKRSLFIATMIRKVNENAAWAFEQKADLEQRAQHAINDSFRFFGFKILKRSGQDDGKPIAS